MPLDLQRIQNVFHAVVEAAPAERIAALERECGADAELRRQVEAILKAHDDSHELLAVDSTQTGWRMSRKCNPDGRSSSGAL